MLEFLSISGHYSSGQSQSHRHTQVCMTIDTT